MIQRRIANMTEIQESMATTFARAVEYFEGLMCSDPAQKILPPPEHIRDAYAGLFNAITSWLRA